ncbi:MAG: nucleotide exchange factor GrpE [Candidatus Latescibacteria bacterium]|nr:nucleotide exchange factor GrpE [Candidatus Latescibacterota bacterium]
MMIDETKINASEAYCKHPVRSHDEGMTDIPDDTPVSSPETVEEDVVHRLTTECDHLRSEVEFYKDRWIRTAAEFENYKKRMSREFGEIVRGANEELLKQLLPVLDNFERALNHIGHTEETEGTADAFRKGVDLISAQFREILERSGLQPIHALGEQFDPHLHEALMQRESDQHTPGTVIDVVEQGYRLNDRVLRHAKVVVSQ